MAERRRAAPVSDNEVSPESLRTYKSKRHANNTKEKSFFDTHLKRKFLLGVLIVSLLLFFCFALWNTFFSDFDQDSDGVKRSSGSHSQPLNYRTGSGNLKGFRDIKDQINIVLTFTNIEKNPRLREKLKICVDSILKHTSSKLVIFLIGDRFSQIVAGEIIDGAALAANSRIRYQLISVDIESLTRTLNGILGNIRSHFISKPGDYYSDDLFFVSMAMHRVMPTLLHKVIMMDIDTKLQADVAQLFGHFDHFAKDHVIGIAHELQPVYRHILHHYRNENPATHVGGPPPDGFPGFNSGVMLIDLDRLRESTLYNSLLQPEIIKNLTEKYKFKGHLGDQDFYTLVALEHPQLFYVLPCTWNRQLCQWWRDKGYENIFDNYYHCEGHINLYHGNCDTVIPE
ncbi:xyloside xylosyltransferase 1-like [Octopus sinensis]|uniref:Xyloside xylosyltransferase 1-like n=1 Tax=Octopus sinensis TaxID=2607531 RepID=A0A6P7TQE1_9MOLL|nr:xyloside xylosyltransferase 1-like [Octopus sinensis]